MASGKSPTFEKSKKLRPTAMDVEEAGASSKSVDVIDAFIVEMLHLKERDLEISASDIVFQGFRPKEFLMYMQRMADEEKVPREQHKKNLLLLGLVCAVRGSKINKIIQSNGSSEKLRAVLSRFRDTYNIIDGRPASPVTATLPRFLAVTAMPVSGIIHQDGGVRLTLPVSPEEVTGGFPLVFCMTHAGALLPNNVGANDCMAKDVAYAQYAQSKSNLWTTEAKIAHLARMDVLRITSDGIKLNTSVEEAAELFDNL